MKTKAIAALEKMLKDLKAGTVEVSNLRTVSNEEDSPRGNTTTSTINLTVQSKTE